MKWVLQVPSLAFVMLIAGSNAFGKIGYFWHITDIHYDAFFNTNGNPRKHCWREQGGHGSSSTSRHVIGRYGDYACDSPWSLIESAGRAMQARQGDNIEFVLWTGDALAHSAAKLSEAARLALLQNVTDLLSRTFSKEFVFPVVGHDDPATVRQLADLWRRWLPPEAMQTFEKGGYYTIEMKERKLRIVVLNTNLWVGRSDRSDGRPEPTGGMSEEVARSQWEWLEMVLQKSRQNRETVYLVGHTAPGADERQGGALPLPQHAFTDKHNQHYLNIVRQYYSIIVGQFFGHLHSDTFRIIYNKKGQPISWIMMAPAVTPRRISGGANNPGLRLYKFDTDTGQVLDYTQFYLDLTTANSNEESDWPKEWAAAYNLTSYYGLNHVTSMTLHNLADKFTQSNPDDNLAFSRYYVANSVNLFVSPSDGGCEPSCAHTHFCAITRVDYQEYRQCLETAASALASHAPIVASLNPFALLIPFVSLIIYCR